MMSFYETDTISEKNLFTTSGQHDNTIMYPDDWGKRATTSISNISFASRQNISPLPLPNTLFIEPAILGLPETQFSLSF